MSDVVPLPSYGEVFFDPRGEERVLRVTWHREMLVLSIWRGEVCTGTFRMPARDVERFFDIIDDGLAEVQAKEEAAAGRAAPAAPGQPAPGQPAPGGGVQGTTAPPDRLVAAGAAERTVPVTAAHAAPQGLQPPSHGPHPGTAAPRAVVSDLPTAAMPRRGASPVPPASPASAPPASPAPAPVPAMPHTGTHAARPVTPPPRPAPQPPPAPRAEGPYSGLEDLGERDRLVAQLLERDRAAGRESPDLYRTGDHVRREGGRHRG